MDIFRAKLSKHMKRHKKLTNVEQLAYLKKLHRLISSGYSLTRALDIIAWEEKYKRISDVIKQSLLIGDAIDEAMHQCGFHTSIVSFMYFVRVNNDLEESIYKSIVMFEQKISTTNKLQKLMRYPIVLSISFVIIFLFLQIYVFPSFIDLFNTISHTSSSFEKSLKIFNAISVIFFILISFFTIGYTVFVKLKNKLSVEQLIKIQQRMPIVSYYTKFQTTYYFSTHIAMFIKAGLSLKEALLHLEKQETLKIISFYAGHMRAELERGVNIDQLILQTDFIDNQVASIFKQNISINALEKDLYIFSEFLQERVQEKSQSILKLIQPIFLFIIASLIILAYVSLILPMLQMIQVI